MDDLPPIPSYLKVMACDGCSFWDRLAPQSGICGKLHIRTFECFACRLFEERATAQGPA